MGIDGIIVTQPVSDILTSILTAMFAIAIFQRLRRESNKIPEQP
jgi:TctA family transporter